ncbi:MAG: LamG domain-containing protein [Acidimicrobiales bacterium]
MPITTYVALAAALLVLTGAQPAGATVTQSLAVWEMNEDAGATIMHDSSGNGFDGAIGDEVILGATFDGAVGYRFPWLKPNTPPAHPEHIVRVPHDEDLNPAADDYTIELRLRTTNKFGNVIQKGQAAAPGGFFKIQLPMGEPSCVFRGPDGVTNAVRARGQPIRDGQWHVIRCERTTNAVELYIDGVFIGRNTGLTGPIGNDKPIYIGGKGVCDQIRITCDYFGGDIDWVRLSTS